MAVAERGLGLGQQFGGIAGQAVQIADQRPDLVLIVTYAGPARVKRTA